MFPAVSTAIAFAATLDRVEIVPGTKLMAPAMPTPLSPMTYLAPLPSVVMKGAVRRPGARAEKVTTVEHVVFAGLETPSVQPETAPLTKSLKPEATAMVETVAAVVVVGYRLLGADTVPPIFKGTHMLLAEILWRPL